MLNPNKLRAINAADFARSNDRIEAMNRYIPLRITTTYFGFSLLWMLVIAVLVLGGIKSQQSFWLFVACQVAFLLITTGLIYWLCRRGFRIVDKANALIRAVTENTTDAVYVKDINGNYIFCNEVAAALIGKTLPEIFDSDDTMLREPESAQKVIAWDRKVMETGERHSYEIDLSVGGKPRTHATTKSPYRDSDGNVIGVVGISRDITAQKQAEAELRAAQARMTLTMQSVPIVVCSFTMLPDGRLSMPYASPHIFNIYGLNPDDVADDFTPAFERIVMDDRPKVMESIRRSAETMTPCRCEFRVQHPVEGLLWVEGHSIPSLEPDGTLIWHGYISNITSRKLVDQKLIENFRELQISEKRFRELADVIPQIVWVADESGKLTHVNAKTIEYTGMNINDLLGSGWFQLIHPDDANQAIKSWNETIHTHHFLYDEVRIRGADGQYRWHLSYTFPIRNSAGDVVEWYSTATDFEELKNVEQSLREQHRLLKIVTSSARVGLIVINDHYEYVFANEAYAELVNRQINQIIGHKMPEVIAAGWPQIKNNLDRVLAGEALDYEVVLPPVPGSNVNRFYRAISKPRIDESGRNTAVTVITDITELKESKRIISESEERYRHLVELLPDAIYINVNNRISFCNAACVRLFGATDRSQLIGKSPFELIPPDAHEHVRNRMATIFETKEPAPPQRQKMIRLDGREIPVYVFATLITDGGVEGILACFNDLTEREQATEVLHSVMGSVDDSILMIDEQGTIQLANPATERLFGYRAADLIGNNVKILMPEPHKNEHDDYLARYIRTGKAKVIGIGRQVDGRRKDGSTFPLELTVTEFQLHSKRHFTGIVRDITERKRMENLFHQSQKMEAVGRLAGGVAHDFNNLLTVINGYSSQMLSDLPADSVEREFVEAILDAGNRAASLTKQLLVLSRKSIAEQVHVDINEIVEKTSKMLRRLIEENIQLKVECDPNVSRILAAPWQIEQVLMNLVINARDAMPHGGELHVKTRNVTVSIDDRKNHPDINPGRYASLLVSDTGHGMSKEVQDRIFEPFFTTKDVGEGTGLGMSVVHGIVKQCGGGIRIESELNAGTAFHILFPVATEVAKIAKPGAVPQSSRGHETILLVEDQSAVRRIARIALETKGYKVLEASLGLEAIRIAEEFHDPIDLLLVDVVMPEMGGQQLAEIMRQMRPGIRVLFMSGYTDDTALLRDVTKAAEVLVQKPFTPTTLTAKVRAVLDGGV
jgi:PAS domain S-box-containing protein